MNVTGLRILLVLTTTMTMAGCAARGASNVLECRMPDAALERLVGPASARTCRAGDVGSCGTLRRDLDRLALICPSHLPTQLAVATLAVEAQDMVTAQLTLDRVLARREPRPDAAALRAQLAIEEGNLPYARRLLTEQITLSPDNAALREVHSALLYLTGEYDAARLELLVARALGAPAWRVAYHQGLVEEATGHADIAATYYRDALAGNASFGPAQSRLTAITRQP